MKAESNSNRGREGGSGRTCEARGSEVRRPIGVKILLELNSWSEGGRPRGVRYGWVREEGMCG